MIYDLLRIYSIQECPPHKNVHKRDLDRSHTASPSPPRAKIDHDNHPPRLSLLRRWGRVLRRLSWQPRGISSASRIGVLIRQAVVRDARAFFAVQGAGAEEPP